jgi:hypothetical protein
MTPEEIPPPDPNETISGHAHLLVALWVTIILLFYTTVAIFGVRQLRQYKAQTKEFRQSWLSVLHPDHQAVPPSSSKATVAAVSATVNRASDFSLREGRWNVDFDVAFRWRGDAVDPGADFHVVNGEILHREKEVSAVVGGERFARYAVSARMAQPFDPTRFPFSKAGLAVQIEDASHDTDALRYVVYRSGIRVSRSALGQGMRIIRTFAGVTLFGYGQDSRISPSRALETHSRFIFGMLVQTRGFEIYTKMFQALFASVAIALVVFFIKPTYVDPRFGLGVGAFFAAIGNNIFLVTLLPPANRVTLTDMVNLVGLVTIFLTLVQSTISLRLCDTGRWRLSRYFDRMCFAIFLVGYVTVNVVLPIAAKG